MDIKHIRRQLLWPATYALALILTWLAGCLPRAGRRLLAALGARAVLLLPSQRRLLEANLTLAFPDWTTAQRRAAARASARQMVKSFIEFLWCMRHPDKVTALVEFSDDERAAFERCRREFDGVILLTPHIGNWEIGHLALCASGITTVAIARKFPNPFIEGMMTRERTRQGSEILHEKGAAKGILKALREGRNIGMLVDQNTRPRHGGIFVKFFGMPATISRAPAMFARRANAQIFVCACVEEANGKYRGILTPLPRPPAEYADDAELSQEISNMTEALVRRYPEQYVWLYQRWRYIPPDWDPAHGEFPYYAKPFRDPRDRAGAQKNDKNIRPAG